MQNCWIDLKKMAELLRNAHQLGQNDDQRSEGMQYLMDHVMSLWLDQSEPVSSGIDLEAFEADDVLGASDTVESWLRELGIAQEEVSGQTGSRDLIVTAGGSQMEGVLYDTALENFEQLPKDMEFTFALAE